MPFIIPIGIDCGLADICNEYKLRNTSLPFDWIVTYNGVSDCIKDNFNNFIPNVDKKNKYNMTFPHHFDDIELDTFKFLRRIKRITDIFEKTKELVYFIRKGHAYHNHSECTDIKNDIKEAEELNEVLKIKYPNLIYKIKVILVCATCFDPNIKYTSTNDSIQIYNIATPLADNDKFKDTLKKLFNI